ncbi:MAG TPA: DUF2336 domain-containing protein [Alphaproteobacteria bacterium]|nr:DUF2336 domain-containing protein [Alphaproteobacteria bacterium]
MLDYETAKRLARDPDPAVRRDLAGRAAVVPEILYYLAADVAAEVRAAIAANPSTPVQADLVLTGDAEEAVRDRLVVKAGAALPPNGAPEPGPLEKLAVEVLTRLASDPSAAVRRRLSDAVQDLEHAPQAVVRTLARDADLAVAEPVLRRSPQLGDDDLTAIASGTAIPGARGAIARRETVSFRVADAIARSDDAEAIAALLANHGAQIREDTLDHILERAPGEESWHRPLVYRPGLPDSAVKTLSRFVALSLMEVLSKREDLDPATADIVAEMLSARLEREAVPHGPAPDPPGEGGTPNGAERARMLAGEGRLEGDDIDDAIFSGDRPFVIAAVAALARVEEQVVERVFRAASGKGTVALAWRAGLGMSLALKLQHQIAHVPARSIVHPRDGADYPLTPEEMAWQLDFFGIEEG